MGNWPAAWKPFETTPDATRFERELTRILTPEHPLFGRAAHALGRSLVGIEVLFAIDDPPGGVAEVHLTWTSRPRRPDWPVCFWPVFLCFAGFDEWARDAIWRAEVRRRIDRREFDPSVLPRLKKGDRVLIKKHYDLASDVRGTISREGRPRVIYDGSTRIEYMVEFDEPQPDDSLEIEGKRVSWAGMSVLEDYLLVADDGNIAEFKI